MLDPLAALGRDLNRVADALDDTDAVLDRIGSAWADALRAEVPRRTGYLASTVGGGRGEATVTAVYAGVIAGGWAGHGIEPNPYPDRAATRAQGVIEDAWEAHALDALDHLNRVYT